MTQLTAHSGIIQLLPDHVANQIAAGEVVQRPASVVKELIENAIDSGADKIRLIVKDAGKTLIQIMDNGCGMNAHDARRSFERHATSKIRKAEDLFAVRTMGFRGEALASIAAVAQVELKTRRHEDEVGILIEIHGSEIQTEEHTATSPGTSFCVKNLFYNIPARRNFLKSNPVEMKHIVEEFQRQVLAHPEIGFTFHSDGTEIYHLQQGTLKQRVVHLFGNHYNQRLVPVHEDTSIITVSGFIGKPNFARKTRGEQFFFVNKRFIKDPYLHHAVMNAFDEVLASDSFPLYVLFIEIDPQKIDINVHPTKTEIKYEDERAIYAIIQSTVKRSLGKYHITPSLDFEQETGFAQMIKPQHPSEIVVPSIAFNPDFNPFESEDSGYKKKSGRNRESGLTENWDSLYQIVHKTQSLQLSLEEQEETANMESQKSISKRLFQLHNRYIISQVHSGFLVIDQQAAHERILYEKIKFQFEAKQGTSQQSLFPQTIILNMADVALFEELLPEICSLGFQIRSLGRNSFIVEGIPADLPTGNNESALLEQLLEDFKANKSDLHLGPMDKMAKSLAKSAAIKAGTPLNPDEMAELIDKLFACSSANTSIYGKPIILTITLQELMSRFEQ